MASIDLIVSNVRITGTDADGNLSLAAAPPDLPRVPLRRLVAMIRCAPHPGAYPVILDTGASVSVFPFELWSGRWRWRAARDFDELSVVGLGKRLSGHVAGVAYAARLVRTRVPVELGGSIAGLRLTLDPLVVQLADPTAAALDPLLGLWGNALDSRSLHITRTPDDDLAARLDYT